jgi:hypothetical protein
MEGALPSVVGGLVSVPVVGCANQYWIWRILRRVAALLGYAQFVFVQRYGE